METFPGCLHRCPCYLETHLSFAVTLVDETVTPGAFSKSSLHISACRTIVSKDRRIPNYTLSCSLTSPDVLFLYNYCNFLLLIVVLWTCLMAAKEVMGRKDINYAKGFVRGKENADSTTEPLRKGQFTNTFLFHRFFFWETVSGVYKMLFQTASTFSDNTGLNSLQCKNNDNQFDTYTFPVLNCRLETKPWYNGYYLIFKVAVFPLSKKIFCLCLNQKWLFL